MLISCDTRTDLRGILTDHRSPPDRDNYDGTRRRVAIPQLQGGRLGRVQIDPRDPTPEPPPPERILNQHQLDTSCETLTAATQYTIQERVPITEITPKSKRWWTKELTLLRKLSNKLGRQSYKRKMDDDHIVHARRKEAAKQYARMLKRTKDQHWRSWLERAEDLDIYAVQRLISAPASDGGKVRIPALKYREGESDKTVAN